MPQQTDDEHCITCSIKLRRVLHFFPLSKCLYDKRNGEELRILRFSLGVAMGRDY